MKKTFSILSFVLFWTFVGLMISAFCFYADRKLAQSTPCSVLCGCQAGSGCSCVAIGADKCSCPNCTCEAASKCCCHKN